MGDVGCFGEQELSEEVRLQEGLGWPRRGGCEGGEEQGEVHHPRSRYGQNTRQASHKGGQEGNVWQGGSGQGEASEDRGEGLRRGRLEEDYLSLNACHRWASSESSGCLRRVGCRAGPLTAAYFSSSPRKKCTQSCICGEESEKLAFVSCTCTFSARDRRTTVR